MSPSSLVNAADVSVRRLLTLTKECHMRDELGHEPTHREAAGRVPTSDPGPETTADPDARFSHEVSIHYSQLRRSARRFVRQPADVDDLIQETLMKAWRAYPTLAPDSHIGGWLYRIMVNTWISRYRATQRRPSELLVADHFEDAFARGGSTASDVSELAGAPALEVQRAVQALPEAQRIVVYYALVEGRRQKDISAITGIPIGTVMSRLHRARQSLRASLAECARTHGYDVPDLPTTPSDSVRGSVAA